MGKLIRIGMDTSKHVFQLHGVDAAEKVALRRRLRRADLEGFFGGLEPTVAVIEACAGAHHLARQLRSWGHTPKILAPQHAVAFRGRNKNDAADAEGLCVAGGRPQMRFVPEKTPEQQAELMLMGVRRALISSRTQISNAIRGYAVEYGLIAPKGRPNIGKLLERVASDACLPPLARKLFALQGEHCAAIEAGIEEVEAELRALVRGSDLCRRLKTIPGVGPVGAAMLMVKVPAPEAFRSARSLPAWIGLTPADHSTGGKQRLGGITRAGDEQLRAVLVSGAMSVIRQAQRKGAAADPWLRDMLARKPVKLVAVALANKIARIAWALMTKGGRYEPDRRRGKAVAAEAA
jgi:transposase